MRHPLGGWVVGFLDAFGHLLPEPLFMRGSRVHLTHSFGRVVAGLAVDRHGAVAGRIEHVEAGDVQLALHIFDTPVQAALDARLVRALRAQRGLGHADLEHD